MVDTSQVVSKWIGETEKNLAAAFDVAERTQAVLFLDEADALFGSRTEISDAHDRYANLETAYLLQRLDRFDGLAVLATNLRHNIDPAFIRRMDFVVEFPLPDPAARRDAVDAASSDRPARRRRRHRRCWPAATRSRAAGSATPRSRPRSSRRRAATTSDSTSPRGPAARVRESCAAVPRRTCEETR